MQERIVLSGLYPVQNSPPTQVPILAGVKEREQVCAETFLLKKLSNTMQRAKNTVLNVLLVILVLSKQLFRIVKMFLIVQNLI